MARPRLFVYEKSLDAVVACEAVARKLPAFRGDLADQLRRASASIALNVAEGAAEFAWKEKIRFYRIARRSAAECQAVLDVADRVLDHPPDARDARRALDETLALLTRTTQAIERRER